jgi:hypothetical protein
MLIIALHNRGGLSAEDHRTCVKEVGNGARKVWMKEEEDYLDGLKVSGERKRTKHLYRMGKTGAWLTAIPNCFDGTELSREKCQDNLAIFTARAPGGFQNAAMDATTPFWLSTSSAAKKVALWDSGMTMYAKNWHTCAQWP